MSTAEPPPRRLGLTRTRIALITVAYVAVGAGACRIFDQVEWTLLTAPLLPSVTSLWTARRPSLVRVGGAVVAVLASTAIAVIVAGGGLGDVGGAISGFQGLLSTEWPSPLDPELVATVTLTLAAATALSAELCLHRRFHLLPLLPLLTVEIASIALSAPAGTGWVSVVVVAVTATTFAVLRDDGGLRERLVLLRGERSVLPFLGIVGVLVIVLAIPLSLTARADPRREDPPQRTAPILDPIEATLALRGLDPPQDLHVVTANADEVLPGRWRTAALSEYNGDRWVPELTLRPIGRTLGTAPDPVVDVDISFLDDDLTLLPLPGPPISVDAAVETDVDRTVVRLAERPEPGDTVGVVAGVAPTASLAGPAVRVIDDDVSTLVTLAEQLAGDGTIREQLTTLEATMRDEFQLDNGVQGGGLQRAFIDIFLRDTQRGNLEQFVTGFVLLARALGVDARVATGFVTEPTAGGTLPLSSADATIWPEVGLEDGTWIAYDPVPEEEVTDAAPPPPRPQTQTPAAPQPPVDPPPDPETETEPPPETAESEESSTLSTALTWGVRGVAGLTLVLLPFVVAAAVIVGLKYRRRRRRLRAASAPERIRGAWATATDGLVDAGVSISVAATDNEIAAHGETVAADSRSDLHRLATLSSTATFGTLTHPELMAEDATRCLRSVERSITSGRTRRQRWWWRLNLRSLRRSTRSPVRV